MNRFSWESPQRADPAWAAGCFDDEVVEGGVLQDEGPRPESTLEKLATLAPCATAAG